MVVFALMRPIIFARQSTISAGDIVRYAAEFGMTPSARARHGEPPVDPPDVGEKFLNDRAARGSWQLCPYSSTSVTRLSGAVPQASVLAKGSLSAPWERRERTRGRRNIVAKISIRGLSFN